MILSFRKEQHHITIYSSIKKNRNHRAHRSTWVNSGLGLQARMSETHNRDVTRKTSERLRKDQSEWIRDQACGLCLFLFLYRPLPLLHFHGNSLCGTIFKLTHWTGSKLHSSDRCDRSSFPKMEPLTAPFRSDHSGPKAANMIWVDRVGLRVAMCHCTGPKGAPDHQLQLLGEASLSFIQIDLSDLSDLSFCAENWTALW